MPLEKAATEGRPTKKGAVTLLHLFILTFIKLVLNGFEGFTLYKPPAADLTHKFHLMAVPSG